MSKKKKKKKNTEGALHRIALEGQGQQVHI